MATRHKKLQANITCINSGELLKEQEHLKQLMGDSAEEQRRKLQEKLKKRKQRKAAGEHYVPESS